MSDIVERLRAPANWLRQDKGSEWKAVINHYDRTPFDAADEIERLRTLLKAIRNFPNLSTHYGTLTVAEIDAALKEDGE